MNSLDTRRTIGGYLFAQAQVHAHVHEGITLSGVGMEILAKRPFLVFQQGMVFGVQCDDLHNHCLKRLQQFLVAKLAPGFDIEKS